MSKKPPILSIFVSSTWDDLQTERRAVIEALNGLRSMKFVGMDYSGACSGPPIDPSLREARECDAYVGIFAGRYGSGITADEYRVAYAEGKPCFIFFKNTSGEFEVDPSPENREKLQLLKAELLHRHTCKTFTQPGDLATQVTAALSNWYEQDFLRGWLKDQWQGPHELKPPLADFVGRKADIDRLKEALNPTETTKIVGLSGMGGVGKTALAFVVAEELCADYPDAQLLIELQSMRHTPLDLARALMRCLEVLGENKYKLTDDINELSKRYRNILSGKRCLIMLDDAANESQVRPFIPPSGCALLVTSHKKLAVPGITHVPLKPLEASDSHNLIKNIAKDILDDDAEQIASLCGHLPLALRAAASLLSVTADLEPANYISELWNEQARLKTLDRDAESLEIGVEATFNVSYERLSEEAKRIFRHLSIFPATFDRKAQEAICVDNSAEHLSDLVRLSLVFFDDRPSRYYLHQLVRIYTGQWLLPNERQAGSQRHASHYLHVAYKIDELYEDETTAKAGLELFDLEWINLKAGGTWTTEQLEGNTEAAIDYIHYADKLKHLLYLRRHPREQIKWFESAVTASRQLQLRVTEGRYLCHLGTAYSLIQPQKAVEYYQQAIHIAGEITDPIGRGNALGGLGNAYAMVGQDRLAIKYYEQCLLQLDELNDERGLGRTLTNLGNIYANLGESRDAVEFYKLALEIATEIEDRRGAITALCNLGDEKASFGKHYDAAEYYQQALSLLTETDELQAAALTGFGNAHFALGKHTQAFECYRTALHTSRETSNSRGEAVALSGLGNAHADLGQLDEALKCHEQALSISRQLDDRCSEAQDLINLGNVYYLWGDTQTALTFHFKALAISREIRSRRYEGMALWNIAQNYDKNERDQAARYAAAAFEILDQIGHPMAEAVQKFIARSKQ